MADLEQAAVWHRQIAALVAAADRAGVAPDDLPAFRARLAAQVFEFTQVASLAGVPLPALQPTASEIAAVSPALGDLGDAAAAQLLRTASATLDAAEAVLRGSPTSVVQTAPGQQSTGPYATFTPQSTGLAEGPPPPVPPTVPLQAKPTDPVGLIAAPAPPEQAARRAKGIEMWRPGARNGAVYGSCALFVAIIQVVLFFSVNENVADLPVLGLCTAPAGVQLGRRLASDRVPVRAGTRHHPEPHAQARRGHRRRARPAGLRRIRRPHHQRDLQLNG